MNPANRQSKNVPMFLALALALFVGNATARASSYQYDFSFDALDLAGWGHFPADDFSFLSPALIGPTWLPGSPYIDSVTFAPPAELNGFEFDMVYNGGAYFAPEGLLRGVTFATEWDWEAEIGSVSVLRVTIFFDPGGYGPGTYASDVFGRGITTAPSGVEFCYTTGTLTITDVPAIPVPGAALLGTIGLMSLAGWRLRRSTC
jgi:hypothetical protein